MLQKCKKCGETYPLTAKYWHKSGKHKSGFKYECKKCANAYYRSYSKGREDINLARLKKWRAENPEKRRSQYWRNEDNRKRNDWAGTLLKAIRSTCRRSGRELTITRDDITEVFEQQSGRCFYSGMKLNFELRKHSPMYPSVDRVDSMRGYTRDNIVVACWWMNRAKFTYPAEYYMQIVDEMRAITSGELEEARRAGLPRVQRRVASPEASAGRPVQVAPAEPEEAA